MASLSLFRSIAATPVALERSLLACVATASTSAHASRPRRSLSLSLAPCSRRTLHSCPPQRLQQTSAAGPSDTARASAQMKRFWKSVSLRTLATHHEVQLDGRSLRTPDGALLAVPREHELLARLIVHEWSEQTRLIKSHALPLTSLAARAIDGFGGRTGAAGEVQDPEGEEKRSKAVEDMLRYAQTDTICFHESEPKALVRLQSQHWDPLLDWVASRFGTRPAVAHDTLVASQPPQLVAALRTHLLALSPLQLAALERALHLTKSIYLSLALVDVRAGAGADAGAGTGTQAHAGAGAGAGQLLPGLDVEGAMHAAWVETRAQIETWGEVEDSHDVGWAELGRELGAVKMAVAVTAA